MGFGAIDPIESVRIELPTSPGPVAQRASTLLARELNERSGVTAGTDEDADLTITLDLDPGIGAEGFTISEGDARQITITGSDDKGLLYGVGKFLRGCDYGQGEFTPTPWRGTSVPKGTLRGIYFATHFNNWHEVATDAERRRYVESLALWGTNSLVVHYPDQWLSGIDDPKSRAWIAKMKRLMTDARAVGMKVGLLYIINAGYTSTPENLRAVEGKGCGGHRLICPRQPKGRKLLTKNWADLMNAFADPGLDLVVSWPYDEGGCNCTQCAPWGSNGYLKLSRDFSTLVRDRHPRARMILSTWCFDIAAKQQVPYRENGEYAALGKALAEDSGWVDGLMIDAHHAFPEYPLKPEFARGLPMVNFAEISMFGQYPWGGFGANPLPQRLQRLWNPAKHRLTGGFPYSEGIYEDLNKILCSQLYWAPDKPTVETVREYIAYEYSHAVVDPVAKAIDLLEQIHMRKPIVAKMEEPEADWFSENTFLGGSRIQFVHEDKTPFTEAEMAEVQRKAEEAFRLIDAADRKLPSRVRTSWRWRILYLRALIDRELVATEGWFQGPALKAAFEEMTRISKTERGFTGIKVPRIDDPTLRY